MSTSIISSDTYKQWIKELVSNYRRAQIKASISVNKYLLELYWKIGQQISTMQEKKKYGSSFFEELSKDLKKELPDVKSFSPSNLRYMERFYLLYKDQIQKFPQLGEELRSVPWGHHKYIIDKLHDHPEKAMFYVQKTIENGWSRALLLNMLDTKLFESQGKAPSNFKNSLPALQSEYATQMIKDPYHFDFLQLAEDYKELELQNALEQNIQKYLLELGSGFAFVGRQVRLEVDGDEYFIDQLFYHIKLHCYIVVELKIVKFEPEFVSKLNFYCNAVNHLIKSSDDNGTIGLLICKEKNNLVAQWTVEKSKEPIAISEYVLTNLIPTKKGETKI